MPTNPITSTRPAEAARVAAKRPTTGWAGFLADIFDYAIEHDIDIVALATDASNASCHPATIGAAGEPNSARRNSARKGLVLIDAASYEKH